MTSDQFNTVIKPKVDGSWNLHTLLPLGLDFFVLLSSLCGVIGSPGQANYAAGSTYQDALAHYRVSLGERAVSLDLGNVLDVGYVAEREGLADALQAHGYSGIQESEMHAMLDYFCDPTCSKSSIQVLTGLETPASMRSKRLDEPFWMRRPMYRHLYQLESPHNSASAHDTEATINYETLIRSADSLAEVGDIISNALRSKLARTLAIERENVDAGRPIHSYGMDSLAAVEVRTWFRRVVGADVAIFEILGNAGIASLALAVAKKSQFVSAEAKKSGD